MPRPRWGQHFLRDDATARRVVARADVRPGDTVLEIGPGTGRLTRALLEVAGHVLAVEIDPALAEALPGQVDAPGRLEVIRGDAAALDLGELLASHVPAGEGARAVASLPYESGTAILSRLLDARDRLDQIAVVVQQEVAERIVASAGGRTYGYLSVLCQDVAEAHIALRLPPGAFRPPPRVDSALVRLERRRLPLRGDLDERRFRAFVGAMFESRRKTLGNNLRRLTGADRPTVDEAMCRAGVDGARRPEELDIESFARLLRAADAAGLPVPDRRHDRI